MPAGFDAERWAESAFNLLPGDRLVTYLLRFAPEVAPCIRERMWHLSHRLRELRGAGVECGSGAASRGR